MKHCFLTLLIITFISCDKEVNCNSGIGESTIISSEGRIVNHLGFDQPVIRHHVPGTIDSFNTYLPCNLPDSLAIEGIQIQFEGRSQKLEEKKEPVTQIAGEEFFVLFITKIQ